MDLLAQSRTESRVTALTEMAPSVPPFPADKSHGDWGLSIGICALVGMKVWELLKKYHADDSALNRELIRGLLDERKMLLKAVLERKP